MTESLFKVATRSLNSYDEELMETILSTYLDEDITADDHREECGGSAKQLLSYLHKVAKSISSTDDANIEGRMDNKYVQVGPGNRVAQRVQYLQVCVPRVGTTWPARCPSPTLS